MATNPPGAGKQLISVSLPESVLSEIDRRARLLNWSRNRYVAQMLQRWYDRGGHPVVDIEEHTLLPIPVNPKDPLSLRTYVGAPSKPAEYKQNEPLLAAVAAPASPPLHNLAQVEAAERKRALAEAKKVLRSRTPRSPKQSAPSSSGAAKPESS